MEATLIRIQRVAERTSHLVVYAGGALLLVSAGFVAIVVIARKIFNFSIIGADELTGYAYAISMAWGFSYVLFQGAHIRVDVLYVRLPFRIRCLLDALTAVVFAFVICFLTYRVFNVLEETLHLQAVSSTPLQVPLWIPQVLLVLGLTFFSFCLLLVLLRTLRALVQGEPELVEQIARAPSVLAKDEPGTDHESG
jgi:TRAP-type C4-dicarboxylate transport system permease small subunit